MSRLLTRGARRSSGVWRLPLPRVPSPYQVLFWLACCCQVAVWLLVSIGGAENPGFRQYEQYLSTLAARGASEPSWGVAALVVLALGLLFVVPILLRWRALIGLSVAVAGLSAGLVAFLPLPCPPRERFCVYPSVGPALEVPHAVAVLVLCGGLLGAIAAGVVQLRAGGAARPRLWPALLTAPLLVAIGSDWLLSLSGLPQRAFLVLGQAAVLIVATAALSELDRRHRLELKQLAAGAAGTTPARTRAVIG